MTNTKKGNRGMSERLKREAIATADRDLAIASEWSPVEEEAARQEFGRAVAGLREQAAKTPAGKLTRRQINAEIAAARRDRKRSGSKADAINKPVRTMKTNQLNRWTLKPPLNLQKRMAELRPDGVCAILVSHRAARKRGTGWIMLRYLLRCGCCDQSVQIYYDESSLEINGVHGSIENWREILLPILGVNPRTNSVGADGVAGKHKIGADQMPATKVERERFFKQLRANAPDWLKDMWQARSGLVSTK